MRETMDGSAGHTAVYWLLLPPLIAPLNLYDVVTP